MVADTGWLRLLWVKGCTSVWDAVREVSMKGCQESAVTFSGSMRIEIQKLTLSIGGRTSLWICCNEQLMWIRWEPWSDTADVRDGPLPISKDCAWRILVRQWIWEWPIRSRSWSKGHDRIGSRKGFLLRALGFPSFKKHSSVFVRLTIRSYFRTRDNQNTTHFI